MTTTATFGVSRRESHDAAAFYNRNLQSVTFTTDTTITDVPASSIDHIYGHSSETMTELPQRLIELYTYRHEVVLDPFMGAGTTAVAAREQRPWVRRLRNRRRLSRTGRRPPRPSRPRAVRPNVYPGHIPAASVGLAS